MADDLDDLGRRLDRIEQLLRRPRETPSRASAGPEVRSARSIVSRVDDVWVAVTEGNDRVVAATERLRANLAELADAVAAVAGTGAERAAAAFGGSTDLGGVRGSGQPEHPRPDGGVPGTEEGEGPVEASGGEGPGIHGGTDEADIAVHLRLNRIEEALAGIAGRLEGVAPAHQDEPPAGAAAGPPAATGPAVELGAEVRRLGQRVEGLAQALEASAARAADDTLAQRLGRLRDQFRR